MACELYYNFREHYRRGYIEGCWRMNPYEVCIIGTGLAVSVLAHNLAPKLDICVELGEENRAPFRYREINDDENFCA